MKKIFHKTNLYITCCRPRQWMKNLLCISAFIITPVSLQGNIETLFYTTISFIFASSFIYVINDLLDIESDKEHPIKKFRPIAFGSIKITEALILSILLLFISIGSALNANNQVLYTIITYIALHLIYCFWGKNKSIADIFFIASGFILRAYAGVVSLNASPSPWFLITAGSLALFLAIQKRKSELIRVSKKNVEVNLTRKVLLSYNEKFLDNIEMLSLNSGFISYMLWASGPQLNGANTSNMLITCPILLMGIFRYQLISQKSKDGILIGESPTRILFNDKGIQLILFTLIIMSWFIIRLT